jgi:hypothetical protein
MSREDYGHDEIGLDPPLARAAPTDPAYSGSECVTDTKRQRLVVLGRIGRLNSLTSNNDNTELYWVH